MADTNDTITRVVPQDGWSPIICHKVPITQTITDIVGDKGPNEIYEGGSIKNFHAKIEWQDQYGGSRVPADITSESSDDYGETWTMNEVQEHAEGFFELDYEGHERDFEVKIIKEEDEEGEDESNGEPTPVTINVTTQNGPASCFAYEVSTPPISASQDGAGMLWFIEESLESNIVTGSILIGLGADTNLIDGSKYYLYCVTKLSSFDLHYTSGEPVEFAGSGSPNSDSSSKIYIRYRWQMNGQEIEDTSGSLEHAITVTDYPVRLEVDAHYEDNFGGHEIEVPIFNSAKVTMKSGEVKDVTEASLIVPESTTTWTDKDGYQTQTWSYTENGRTVTAQVGANITALRDTKIEAELYIPDTWGNEDGKDYWYTTSVSSEPTIIFREGATVAKSNLIVTMTRNDGSTYTTTDYWMPNNYALGRNKQIITVQKGSLSTTLPVTVAYPTKVEVGNGGNLLTFITKTDDYDLFRVNIDIPNGVEWISVNDNDMPLGFGLITKSDLEDQGVDSSFLEDGKYYITFYEEDQPFKACQEWYWGDSDFNSPIITGGFIKSSFYEYGEYVEPTHYNAHYECYDGTEGFDEVAEIDGEWNTQIEEETLGEYGSEVGTLTLGSKKYLYRVGLEPIDEENYLFIKDFKAIPFNYGLVKCYEPQWEEPALAASATFLGEAEDAEGPWYIYRLNIDSIPPEAVYDEGTELYAFFDGGPYTWYVNTKEELTSYFGDLPFLGDWKYYAMVDYPLEEGYVLKWGIAGTDYKSAPSIRPTLYI